MKEIERIRRIMWHGRWTDENKLKIFKYGQVEQMNQSKWRVAERAIFAFITTEIFFKRLELANTADPKRFFFNVRVLNVRRRCHAHIPNIKFFVVDVHYRR